MCGFIAQLVEHRTGIAEVTGSNPVEAPIFSSFFFITGLQASLLQAYTVFHMRNGSQIKTLQFCPTD